MRIIPRVLDSTYGRAAVGVSAILTRADGVDWEPLAKAESGRFGCFEEWLRLNLARGFYRISFDCGSYFSSLGELGAYPEVCISFRLREEFETLSIRLDLSPYSYTVHFATDLSGRHSRPVAGCGDAEIVQGRPHADAEVLVDAVDAVSGSPPSSHQVRRVLHRTPQPTAPPARGPTSDRHRARLGKAA